MAEPPQHPSGNQEVSFDELVEAVTRLAFANMQTNASMISIASGLAEAGISNAEILEAVNVRRESFDEAKGVAAKLLRAGDGAR